MLNILSLNTQESFIRPSVLISLMGVLDTNKRDELLPAGDISVPSRMTLLRPEDPQGQILNVTLKR